MPLLGVVPDLGGESQNPHAVPGVDLGLPQRPQANLSGAALPGRVVNARALSETAVAGPVAEAVGLVLGLALVLLILVLFVLLEAGVAEVLVVPAFE